MPERTHIGILGFGAIAAQGAGDARHPAACHNLLPLPSGERVGVEGARTSSS